MVTSRARRTDLNETWAAASESVAPARQAIVDYAARVGASEQQLETIRLAASEAITNVVLHAYDGEQGFVHVTAAIAGGDLCVLVADEGHGFRPHVGGGGLGLGLLLIAEACDELTIVKASSGGTELWMWFKLGQGGGPLGDRSRGFVAPAIPA
jgi:anti-sigma regulatory factor (Ser/Thr protein kinase)